MSYDHADWHYGGDFPQDLPWENGGTHIGMFLAWAIMNGLISGEHEQDCQESIAAVRSRLMTGRQFLFRECDGKLCESDLNNEGNIFAKYYCAPPDNFYIKDYADIFASNFTSLYHVVYNWKNYDTIASLISERFEKWKSS